MSIQDNIQIIKQELTKYPRAKLVVVSKNRSLDEINQAIEAGAEIIAENRVQEAEKKFPLLPSSIKKHLIGHLQSNKVKKVIPLFDMIESVDSYELAEKINQECSEIQKIMPILMQINISDDEHKFGFTESETMDMYKKIVQLPWLDLQGLMTIPKQTNSEEETKEYFKNLYQLFKKIAQSPDCPKNFREISMGMSSDWQIALQEGATIVRIGSFIFQ